MTARPESWPSKKGVSLPTVNVADGGGMVNDGLSCSFRKTTVRVLVEAEV